MALHQLYWPKAILSFRTRLGPIGSVRATLLAVAAQSSGVWAVSPIEATTASACFTVVPACDPDYTQDGNVDQGDVDCLIDLIAGNPVCSPLDPDFNQDGSADQSDVALLIAVIAGQPCP